jgi:hypothetical protein
MDEIIVNGVKITRIDPLDLQNLLHEANQTWMEGMMQLIQQSLQEDISNFNLGTEMHFAGYETSDGQRIQLQKTQNDLPIKNDDGLEIEAFEQDAYDFLQSSFDNDDSTFEPIIVEYDEATGVMFWDFLVA